MNNVFKDLGLPDAETEALKATLVARIYEIMQKGKPTSHTVEQLEAFLTTLEGSGKPTRRDIDTKTP